MIKNQNSKLDPLKDKVASGIQMAQDALIEDLPDADVSRISELVSYIEKQQKGHKSKIGENYELIGAISIGLAQEHEYDADYLIFLLGKIYSDIDDIFG